MIRYKVVRHRGSVFAKDEYHRSYTKGAIVEAAPKTFGLMTFDTYSNALKFIHKRIGRWLLGKSGHLGYEIIKVRPIGRGKRIKLVAGRQSSADIFFFYLHQKRDEISLSKDKNGVLLAPPGTICYQSVKVLE